MLLIKRYQTIFVQALFWLLIAGMFIHSHFKGADFHVFFIAGQRVLNQLSVYSLDDGWMPFKYHPIWAIFFSGWALMPEKVALFLFNGVQLWCWILGAKFWAEWVQVDLKNWSHRLLLLIISLSALSCDLGYGQINGATFLGMTLIFKFMESEEQRPLMAGFIAGVLLSIKLNLGLLFFYLLFKNPRSLIGLMLSALAMHIGLAVFYQSLFDFSHYDSWLRVMITQSSNQFHIYEAQGFLRFFIALSSKYGSALWLSSMLVYVLFGFYLIRKKIQFPCVPMYWMAGCYLFSPLAWWYQILFLYPLAFYLLKNKINKFERGIVFVCLFLYAFCNFNTLGREGIRLFKEYHGYFILSLLLLVLFLKTCLKAYKSSHKALDQ